MSKFQFLIKIKTIITTILPFFSLLSPPLPPTITSFPSCPPSPSPTASPPYQSSPTPQSQSSLNYLLHSLLNYWQDRFSSGSWPHFITDWSGSWSGSWGMTLRLWSFTRWFWSVRWSDGGRVRVSSVCWGRFTKCVSAVISGLTGVITSCGVISRL